MQSQKQHYRIDRSQIAYLRFILEAYDGLAVMRTVDPAQGLVTVYVSDSCQEELGQVMAGLAREMRIEPVSVNPCGDFL